MELSLSRRRSILLTFGKLTIGLRGKHNATKPNNAWWRWIRSGQRNPPVICKSARRCCDRLFKIAHVRIKQCCHKTKAAVDGKRNRAVPHGPVARPRESAKAMHAVACQGRSAASVQTPYCGVNT
jgi:hypothetical protein